MSEYKKNSHGKSNLNKYVQRAEHPLNISTRPMNMGFHQRSMSQFSSLTREWRQRSDTPWRSVLETHPHHTALIILLLTIYRVPKPLSNKALLSNNNTINVLFKVKVTIGAFLIWHDSIYSFREIHAFGRKKMKREERRKNNNDKKMEVKCREMYGNWNLSFQWW